SGTSQTMKEHFKWFAEWTKEYVAPVNDICDTVLDIGCNDGSQLDAFKDIGFHTYGVDPATNLHGVSTAKGHNVTCGYFDLEFTNTTVPTFMGDVQMKYD